MDSDPFSRPYCPAAWYPTAYLGLAGPGPVWRRTDLSGHVHAAGLLELLAAAQLPAAELRHMGAPAWLLEPRCPEWVGADVAVPLLGRVVWDALLGTHGRVWDGSEWAQRDAMGEAVVARYFS